MDSEALKVFNLCGGYGNKKVIKDLTTTVLKGSMTAIIGPNGSGKSTLLKYLIKELKPTSGSVAILGRDIKTFSQKQLSDYVSFVGQNFKSEYEFTVRELVSLGRYGKKKAKTNNEIVTESINKIGIENIAENLITEISGGELQLTMLARAVCQETEIILLDEPSNNLDPFHQIKILKILKELADGGKTIICVMHDLNSVLNWFPYTILIKDGTVFAQGKTTEVLTSEIIEEVFQIKCNLVNQECGQQPVITYCTL